MAKTTKIQWTDHTFNPHRGCTKVSAGCKNCYADTQSKRNPATLGVWGPDGKRVLAAPAYWTEPLKWDKEAKADGVKRKVFCASLADIFEDASTCHDPAEYANVQESRARLWPLIETTPNLIWLLLTKRPENFGRMLPTRWLSQCPDNVWLGTSVEDQKAADDRISHLCRIPAKVRFLSCEPLLGPVNLQHVRHENSGVYMDVLNGTHIEPGYRERQPFAYGMASFGPINWVIVGGESGSNARPMHRDWARTLRNQCVAAGVPFFFKQWGEWRTGNGPIDDKWKSVFVAPDGDICTSDDSMTVLNFCRLYKGKTDLVYKIGKNETGRLLDFVEWNQFPQEQEAPHA